MNEEQKKIISDRLFGSKKRLERWKLDLEEIIERHTEKQREIWELQNEIEKLKEGLDD